MNFLIFLFSILITADIFVEAEDNVNLDVLFNRLLKKHETVKNNQLIEFINQGAPGGVDAPIPAIAEYETFKSDKSANFLNDGQGHVVFRQFRRIRISDLLGSNRLGFKSH